MWMRPPRTLPLWLMAVLATGAVIVLSNITYQDVLSDAWSSCSTKKAGEILYGSICHSRYFFGLGLFILFDGSLFYYLYQACKYKSEISLILGPHIRITRDSFWCSKFSDTLKFSDVIDVEFNYVNVRYGEVSNLKLFLRTPLKLVNGAEYTLMNWSRLMPGICVTSEFYDSDIHSVLHATYCLIRRYRRERSSKASA
jgi:hypothetical protein